MSSAIVPPLQDAFPYPPTNLPEEDGVSLESDWHRLEMTLLIELVGLYHKGRDDYFVGGNMFIYFDSNQVRNRHFRGPDFFFVQESQLYPLRKYWAIWDEGGKYPDVIIELSSPSTADEDHGVKKKTYEKTFRTREYFIYDPDEQQLQGWRLSGPKNTYAAIGPNENGWLWCEELGLWLGHWQGKYQQKPGIFLRFFNKDGSMIATAEEMAEAEKKLAEAQSQRAEAEKKRAEAEKQRADRAEAELTRLRAQLQQPPP
jgi:Uma2 family endonuclease